MDGPDSEFAVIEALGAIRERMIAHALLLGRSAGVAAARSGVDVRDYPVGGLHVEAWVEAERTDGCASTWWLEARRGEAGWTVEASVLEDGPQGQDVVRRFEVRTATTSAGLAAQLTAAAEALCADAVAFDGTHPMAGSA
jgi:hypothetical protein